MPTSSRSISVFEISTVEFDCICIRKCAYHILDPIMVIATMTLRWANSQVSNSLSYSLEGASWYSSLTSA